MLYLKNILKIWWLALLSSPTLAHEQWLLTKSEIAKTRALPPPVLFSHITPTNSALAILASGALFIWVYINHLYPPITAISPKIIKLCRQIISITTGLMLILCALGLIPKVGVAYFQEPVLLASDLLISQLNEHWFWLRWAELFVGILFLSQHWYRVSSITLLSLIILGIFLFGKPLFQYMGFYLSIIYFLLASKVSDEKTFSTTLKVIQTLTGLNFLYSAISVKWLYPNVDIFMIEKHQAFTFGIPADYFVFLMFLTEVTFGLLIIIGYRLRIVASLLMLVFIFMSINFSENFLSHCFVYGILLTFIITNGYPLFRTKKAKDKY